MRRLRALIAPCILALATAAAGAAPVHVEMSYDLLRNGTLVARIQESYVREGDGYRIASETAPAGLLALVRRGGISVVSRGTVRAGGLWPEHFEHRVERGGAPKSQARFDWQAGQLDLRSEGRSETLRLERGTQDRLSAMYQFMHLSLEGVRELRLPLTNGAKVEEYRYEVRHGERVTTPVASFPAVRLIKRRAAGENSTEIWLAADQGMLPVRVVIEEGDGVRLEQIVTRLSARH